jgi:hypothetical protein
MDAWSLVDLAVTQVLGANLVAGMVLGFHLQRASRMESGAGLNAERESDSSNQGGAISSRDGFNTYE